jgi:hypothetical protein
MSRSTATTVSRWWHAVIAAFLVLLFTDGADANSGQAGEALSLGVRLWRLFSYDG